MKTFLSTTALVLLLATSTVAIADDTTSGKSEGSHHAFMDNALSKLPEASATKFRETMHKSREKDDDLATKSHGLQDELKSLLTAKTFDKSAYLSKSKELSKLRSTMQDHRTKAFATAASHLSQEDRTVLAENMHQGYAHHGDPNASNTEQPSENTKAE
jgi:uncharacterized membrane protein